MPTATASATDALLTCQADNLVFYQSVRAYHWMVPGHVFFTLHEQFEQLYVALTASGDEIAERLLTIGATPVLTLTEAVAKASLAEVNPKDWKPDQMVQGTIDGLTKLLESFHSAADVADEAGDRGTVALLEDLIQQYEKRRWMFQTYLGTNPTN
ncbi:MAG: DNA starvation/stationary phase protection protein [Phycisphaerales bacterium JB065]